MLPPHALPPLLKGGEHHHEATRAMRHTATGERHHGPPFPPLATALFSVRHLPAEQEAEYQLYKTADLGTVFFNAGTVITLLTILYVLLEFEDLSITGTLWPTVFIWRTVSASLVAAGMLGMALMLRVGPVGIGRRIRLRIDGILFVLGIFVAVTLGLETNRIVSMLGSSYAHEIELWIRIHDPPKLRTMPACKAYVNTTRWSDAAGVVRCFHTDHEAACLTIVIMYMAVLGLYCRMSPARFFVVTQCATLWYAVSVAVWGHNNSTNDAVIFNAFLQWCLFWIFFLSVRRNEGLSRQEFMRVRSLHAQNAKQAVEQHARLHELEREMMAITCHEVRNPLNGAVGHLRLAQTLLPTGDWAARHTLASEDRRVTLRNSDAGAAADDDDQADPLAHRDTRLGTHVHEANACMQVALSFLARMNSLHKLKGGRLMPAMAPFSVREVISDAAAVISPQLPDNVVLHLDLPPVVVVADRLMTLQILTSLLQNAVRFTSHGYVEVACTVERRELAGESTHSSARSVSSSDGGERGERGSGKDRADGPGALVVSVRDTGGGIKLTEQHDIFDLYTSRGGVGLGLHLTKNLCELQGSEVRVCSPWCSEHAGSQFSFRLALAPEPVPSTEPPLDVINACAAPVAAEGVNLCSAQMSTGLPAHAATSSTAPVAAPTSIPDVHTSGIAIAPPVIPPDAGLQHAAAAAPEAARMAVASVAPAPSKAAGCAISSVSHATWPCAPLCGEAPTAAPGPSAGLSAALSAVPNAAQGAAPNGAPNAAQGAAQGAAPSMAPSMAPRMAPSIAPSMAPRSPKDVGAALEKPAFDAGVRVLIVDDMKTNRMVLRVAFKKHFGKAWTVVEREQAFDGVEAVASARAAGAPFAIVVMDEITSDDPTQMRGSEAIAQIKAGDEAAIAAGQLALPTVRISCTGNAADPEVAQAILQCGAHTTWSKPFPSFTNGDLQREVASLLRTFRMGEGLVGDVSVQGQ